MELSDRLEIALPYRLPFMVVAAGKGMDELFTSLAEEFGDLVYACTKGARRYAVVDVLNKASTCQQAPVNTILVSEFALPSFTFSVMLWLQVFWPCSSLHTLTLMWYFTSLLTLGMLC